MKPLRVLIGCECSGVVRRAFRAIGHDAWSCDTQPADDGSPYHIQADVLTVLDQGWDLGIFHPTCTYLCNSGVRWLSPGGILDPERHRLMKLGCDLFAACYWANIPRVAVENPVMHKYAKDYLLSVWKVPDYSFSVQPWQHGDGEIKRTCFWTRNLPDLVPSNIVSGRTPRIHYMAPGPNRTKDRSRTYEGIGKALAAQWGSL